MNSIADFATYLFRPSTTQEIPWRNHEHEARLTSEQRPTYARQQFDNERSGHGYKQGYKQANSFLLHTSMPETFWEIWVEVYAWLGIRWTTGRLRLQKAPCLWTESWESFVFVKEKRKKSNISCCKSIPRKTSLSRRPCNKWCCVNPSSQTILLWSLIIISILREIRCFLDIYRKPVSSLAIIQYRTKRRQTIISDLFSVYIQ